MDLRCTRYIAMSAALAALAGSARAGELGPTSRATVAISITIAPHVAVKPASVSDPSATATGLCIATNGLKSFRVEVASSSSNDAVVPAPAPLLLNGAELDGGCGATEFYSRFPQVSMAQLGLGAANPNSPVTLLVAPD